MKLSVLAASLAIATGAAAAKPAAPFMWENATVYFLLTDRFHNGDPRNDLAYGRKADAAPMRGYMGGDLAGITEKIRSGYFRDLGVDALWITPPVEQIHGSVDEGTGKSYGFHGYWAKDFTAVDASLGTEADVRKLVDTAHAHGIRVLLDVVMNHTGPVTATDPVWPADWVRTGPKCTYKDAKTTIECTLVENLPDILTESDAAVELPPHLAAKWKKEGRYEREMAELDEFFRRTGYPRAPRYYLMKWHADWVRKYGFDGFRADTVKHTEAGVWKELKTVASEAYEDWKRANPSKKLGDEKFYMTSEVYHYGISHGDRFDNGGKVIDYFDHGFDSMINFQAKTDAAKGYEQMFSDYSSRLNGWNRGTVLNYLSSHDDGGPFDKLRTKPFETANKLLLAPGAAQIYYGDETARVLQVEGAEGDANLRSPMNWKELAANAKRDGYRVADVRKHWSRLGQFRKAHVSIGAGVHEKIADAPYTFKRSYSKGNVSDKVVVAIDAPKGAAIDVGGAFTDGTRVRDHYSGARGVVAKGKVRFPASGRVILVAAD
ncbi:MAG TPA: alpha-amylase family glycosyl hydrolase [Telluria sp.]|nr:alpha-amylase family glycosyl hydrolase [Telluria sp.]